MNKHFTIPGDLLVSAEHGSVVVSLLQRLERVTADSPEFKQAVSASAKASDDTFWTEFEGTWLASLRPYRVRGSTLTIPVKGMLLKGFPFAWGGIATGYEYIEAAIARGVADPDVTDIILDIDSPGGTVAGCFDCADAIYEARGAKPIRAYANESAYSAAYAIASAADTITVARTGGVGSIGVIMQHADVSAMMERWGVKITMIYAGEHKADGSPFEPLSDEVRARFQERIDALYDIFVSTVARNRDMDEQAVRDTEAATFMPKQAVEKGLADAVGSLGSLSANADHSNDDEDEQMSKENLSVAQADHEAAVAAAKNDGVQAGKAEGAQAERARISAIMDSEEAKSHPAAARHVALNTDMTAEAAASFLKGLPEEKTDAAPTGQSSFETHMNAADHPNLGAGDGNGGGEEMSISDKIFASAGYAPIKS
ncbi:signal peptide peptidase A [Ruegeria phage vB_RpoS-V16]|uniref:head maturation protease n=1 Tax=Ruegeria phage vB_RpoS-V16 TaxID=2218618 RepID=UPI000DCAC33D|nr:head maturation protease [Ruegeria phage vB_RpoS-V16]AWY09497.1 signal peptide peptidase A [Ruegeria phage vB_RpoS-V16]